MLTLNENTERWLIRDKLYAHDGRSYLGTACAAALEYKDQNPCIEWIEGMPLLEKLFYELVELDEDLNRSIEQLRSGQVDRELMDSVIELSDHRLGLQAFLTEQFEGWKRLTAHEDTLITFDQLLQDLSQYRRDVESWIQTAIDKEIYRFSDEEGQ